MIFFGILISVLTTFSQAEVIHTKEGEWIKKKNYLYRYVSTYEIKQVERPLKNFPWIEQDCHDQGNRFANWSKSHSYEITYSGKINFNLLGISDLEFGKDRSKTVEFTFQRWVTPTLGMRARHVLYENFEIWEGITHKEYLHGENLIRGQKTYPFRLEKMNYGISVKRKNREICQNEND